MAGLQLTLLILIAIAVSHYVPLIGMVVAFTLFGAGYTLAAVGAIIFTILGILNNFAE